MPVESNPSCLVCLCYSTVLDAVIVSDLEEIDDQVLRLTTMSVIECEEQTKQHYPTQGQVQAIRTLITDCETNAQKFTKVLRAPKLTDLTRKEYCSAILKISTATVWYMFIKQFSNVFIYINNLVYSY